MKRLSIKGKITLWYTTLVILILLAVVAFLYASSEKIIYANVRNTLTKVTMEMSEEIDVEESYSQIDDDFNNYEKGVILLALTENSVITGHYPKNFPVDIAAQPGNIYTVQNGDEQWLVYDVHLGENLYVRGIHPLDEFSSTIEQTLKIALFAVPFIIFIAAIGGYFIAKKAFAPVSKMTETAGKISNGYDLSKRINLENTGDEIYALSTVFDHMLERLEQAFEDEKQFTSDVSHELRTPISVLKSQCEYALTKENNIETQKALKDMLAKTNQMANLVSQLLTLSRAQNQTASLKFEHVDISELLEIIAEETQRQVEKKNIILTVQSENNICLDCEKTLIMRLVINLLENAIKYTNHGGRITLALSETTEEINISVSDTGIGISSEHLKKIFNRFYKVNSSRVKENESSFGLGLAFCKWIVLMHKGNIDVVSEIGCGSTFNIRLPKVQ